MENEQDDPTDLKRILIDGLDRILFELGRIDTALLDAPRMHDTGMVREARRRATLLFTEADAFLTWVTDTSLEPRPN